jgi:hypothetical protein
LQSASPAERGARGVDVAVALGYVTRAIVGFDDQPGQGATVSVGLWRRHATVRSFTRLELEWIHDVLPGANMTTTGLLPTFGIAWRPESPVDVWTSIGLGLEHCDFWSGSRWVPAARAAFGALFQLPARMEATASVTLDVLEPRANGMSQNLQPGFILSLAWRPTTLFDESRRHSRKPYYGR